MPKYLGYFERLLAASEGGYVTGRKLTYVDLSLFQIVDGLRYAFPNRMKNVRTRRSRAWSSCTTASRHVRTSAAYLASERRIPFNEDGIFRHYKALDL